MTELTIWYTLIIVFPFLNLMFGMVNGVAKKFIWWGTLPAVATMIAIFIIAPTYLPLTLIGMSQGIYVATLGVCAFQALMFLGGFACLRFQR